ncbi:hypothetical protein FQN57_000293 [Myotisia sp. PD_48]|nr:hypothetical protein FQN57_000293 [Myotisia sp. PD_48]
MATQQLSFWDPRTSASLKLAILHDRGTTYKYEHPVWQAWAAIVENYFPRNANTNGGDRWAIDREPYRGLPAAPHMIRPDIAAIRLSYDPLHPYTFGRKPVTRSRDYIWVECKAPDPSTPAAWKNVLYEVITRLQSAHPTRVIILMIGVGLKFMYFIWLPGAAQPPLNVLKDDGTTFWPLDPRIQPLTTADPWLSARQVGNLWVNLVNPKDALSLDTWSPSPNVGFQLLHQNDHHQLENLLRRVLVVPLPGTTNSPHFA